MHTTPVSILDLYDPGDSYTMSVTVGDQPNGTTLSKEATARCAILIHSLRAGRFWEYVIFDIGVLKEEKSNSISYSSLCRVPTETGKPEK